MRWPDMTTSTRKPLRLNEFYSYPAWLIAKWLGVHVRTAKRYKGGHRVPRPALRLFTLMRDRRVFLDEAWNGWTVQGDKLYTPAGEPFTPGLLTAYVVNLQLLRELQKTTNPSIPVAPEHSSNTAVDGQVLRSGTLGTPRL